MGLRVVKIMVRWWVDGCVVRKSVIRRAQMARPRPLVYLLDCLVCCEGGVVVRWYGGMGTCLRRLLVRRIDSVDHLVRVRPF